MELQKRTPKAESTRRRILDGAYNEFINKGYEGATMRDIASRAKIAAGGIYHYFPSKEHMVHEFYNQTHDPHEEACKDFFETHKKFKDRLRAVVRLKIEQAQPFHKLSKVLFRVASNRDSSLSPFSQESRVLRLKNLALFTEVVEGCDDKIPKGFRRVLPEYLWLYQMGIILFWIHDSSPGAKKTMVLIDRTVELIQWQLEAIGNPLFLPFRKKILNILIEFHPQLGGSDE